MPTAFQTALFEFKQTIENCFNPPHPMIEKAALLTAEEVPPDTMTLCYAYDDRALVISAYATAEGPLLDLEHEEELLPIPAMEYIEGLTQAFADEEEELTWSLQQYLVVLSYLSEQGYDFMLIESEEGVVPEIIATREDAGVKGFIVAEIHVDQLDMPDEPISATTLH